jgi:hypothetical protein
MALRAAQLMQAPVLATDEVHVPEWAQDGDDVVVVRVMNGLAMSAYQSRLQALTKDRSDELQRKIMLEYVAASIIDPETKELVFDSPEKIEVLGKLHGKGLQRVFQAASKLNRDDEESAADFPKASGTTPAGSTGGSTPSISDSPILT